MGLLFPAAQPAPCPLLPAPAPTSHPPSPCPQTRGAAGRAPLPRAGAGSAALHFTGPLQVGYGDGSCPFAPLATGETPSSNWGLAGGPSPATGASLVDPILQMGLCWGTPSRNQGLAASSQLSLETNFLPFFASASSREAAASSSPLPALGLGAQRFWGGLGQAPLRRPSCSLHGCKQGL